jgi:DnaJ-class molecular chaperone
MAQSVADHYKILGVKSNATKAEIKKSYRALAKKHHPDANNGSKKAENKFKSISVAYDILSDKKKRSDYDRERSYKKQNSRASSGGPSWQDPDWGKWSNDFRQRDPGGPQQGPSQSTTDEPYVPDPNAPASGFDLQFIIDLPLETVAMGGTVPYSYEKYVNCAECEGTGELEDGPCGHCEGKKQVVEQVTVDIKIPPGVADQYTLRNKHMGGEGKNGGPPGDLFLKINTLPKPGFKRVKDDIYSYVTISPDLAEHGGPLEVKTLNSTHSIQVEEGTLTGEELRIPGEGAAILWGKKRGDLIIKFIIEDD